MTCKPSNVGLTRADRIKKVNNSGIAMSGAEEVVSTNALTLHFLQAKRGETKYSLLLIMLHTAERQQAARPQQITTMCTQRINFHCQQLVISESQKDSQIINSTLVSRFMSLWSHAEPIKSLVTLPSWHRGWKLKL